MYEAFFHLRERPFDLTPDPRYLFLTPKHHEALSNLQYGIRYRKAVTVVAGPAGTGKTTLIRAALAKFDGATDGCVSLTNPTMTRDEFVRTLAEAFALSEEAARSKAVMLRELEMRLRKRLDQRLTTALIVDEAQALPVELLEEIRLLVNLETDQHKLLPVVLVGQPEFAGRLNEPAFAALKQRVALRCELLPLTPNETKEYIATRARVAGGAADDLFTREATELIHERSRGVPRLISVICDNALLSGYAVGQKPVDHKIVLEVCDDFDLSKRPNGNHPPQRSESAGVIAEPPKPEMEPTVSVGAPLFTMFATSPRSGFFK